MTSKNELVPGIGKPPYDRSIIGDKFFFEGRLVQVYQLVGGDKQVAVMDTDKGSRVPGYPSVSQLVPAVTPDLADKHKYDTVENRYDDLERRLAALEAKHQSLLERLERKGD